MADETTMMQRVCVAISMALLLIRGIPLSFVISFVINVAETKSCCSRNKHYYTNGLLSRLPTPFCPGFGTGTRLPGQKPLEAFVPGGRTGTKGA